MSLPLGGTAEAPVGGRRMLKKLLFFWWPITFVCMLAPLAFDVRIHLCKYGIACCNPEWINGTDAQCMELLFAFREVGAVFLYVSVFFGLAMFAVVVSTKPKN